MSKLLGQGEGGGGCLNFLERFAAPGGGYQKMCTGEKK